MSVKILPTCEAANGSFRCSSKRPFGMLNTGGTGSPNSSNNNAQPPTPSRTRQGLKLSFSRSISEPQAAAGGVSSPHKRFCPPPFASPEDSPSPSSSSSSSGGSNDSSATSSPCLTPSILQCSAMQVSRSPLQRSLLFSKVKSIRAEELVTRLSSGASSPPLLVDCRSFIAFNVNHIKSAFNVNVCDRFNRKRLQHGKASLGDLAASIAGKEVLKNQTWKEIVVYDDSSEALESLPPGHTLLIVLNALLEDGREPVVLSGGFRAFELLNRSFCENHLMEEDDSAPPFCRDLPSPSKDIENHPVTQVLPHMFLGNMRDAGNPSALTSLGIHYVLNVTSKPPGYTLDPRIRYKQLIAADNGFQNLHQFFEEAFEFIDLAKRNSSGVLIHCQAGVSRSPTIAVAYLMKYYPMAMSEAYKFVKSRRSIISPNLNFMGQLWEFEQGLLSNNKNRLLPPLRRTSSFSEALSASQEPQETSSPPSNKNNQDFNSNLVADDNNILLNSPPEPLFRQ